MERKRRFQTRQQYAEQQSKQTKFQKADKRLNYLIAIVAVLIVATLIFIITQEPEPENKAEQDSPAEVATDVPEDDAGQETEDNETETNVPEEVEEEDTVTDETETEQPTSESGDTVSPSDDPSVKEVITNPNWPAYPTAQTGEHVSTYEKGHIDYEEKLKAIFSVLDLQQENSIVLRVNNNGSTESAIAVVTSMDKEQKYRVSIEWVDNEGWKPVQVEVLTTLEGSQ
ncbi:YrrS family protein [Solibacillus sp. FSL W7-1436]|uniref:YrrS family protein n=1 Tax=Solibacillus sp. FSL W7-1436 TaxID=2921705 RepID=UPI0030FB9B2D